MIREKLTSCGCLGFETSLMLQGIVSMSFPKLISQLVHKMVLTGD